MKVKKQEPLFMQAYEIIKNKILYCDLEPGSRVLEVRLGEELGVSRNPIREALRLLMQDGLVLLTDNGYIVHPMSISDIEEIYECRMMVEPFAGALAAQRASKNEINSLNTFIDQSESCYKAGDIDGSIKANSNFHKTIVLLSKNKSILKIFNTIDNLVVMSRNIEMKIHQRSIDYLDQHREMVRLLEQGASEEIKILVEDHIDLDWKYFKECSLKKVQ